MTDKRVELGPMKQLFEAVNTDDDWTGLTDPAARRKRQNRLHQRAWRRRKEAQERSNMPPVMPMIYQQPQISEICQGYTSYSPPYASISAVAPTTTMPQTLVVYPQQGKLRTSVIPPIIPYEPTKTPPTPHLVLIFSLPVDQRLITLIQYNTLRATLTNMVLLNIIPQNTEECALFTAVTPSCPPPSAVPPSLYPTLIQLSTPHEPWIDVIPSPNMRDNLILNEGKYDPEDLCCDVAGGLYEGFDDIVNRGVMIWGEPWTEEGWEVSEGFATKWGWMLTGCGNLIRASNRWREKRGEDRLIVEV